MFSHCYLFFLLVVCIVSYSTYLSCGCNSINISSWYSFSQHSVFLKPKFFTAMKLPSIVTSYFLKCITLNILGIYFLQNYIFLKIVLILIANLLITYIMRMKRNYRIIILIKILRKMIKWGDGVTKLLWVLVRTLNTSFRIMCMKRWCFMVSSSENS